MSIDNIHHGSFISFCTINTSKGYRFIIGIKKHIRRTIDTCNVTLNSFIIKNLPY